MTNKLKKILQLLEFIATFDFNKLPDNIKNLINNDSVLKNYTRVLKSSHYYRIVYSKDIITKEKLQAYSNKLKMPVTFENNTLLIQYKDK